MSIKLMSRVWDSDLPAEQKFVLLYLADRADDEGNHAWPSKATIAAKTSLSERTVQRKLRELRLAGLIEIAQKASRYRPTEYQIRGDRLAPLADSGETESPPRGDRESLSGETHSLPNLRLEPPENPPRANGKRRPEQVMFEAVVEVCGWALDSLTTDARGRANNAEKQLRKVGAEPDDIRTFATFWHLHHPDADLTPQAITGNWPRFKSGELMTTRKGRR